MVFSGSLQFSQKWGLCRSQERRKHYKSNVLREKLHLLGAGISSQVSFQQQNLWSIFLSDSSYRPISYLPYRYNVLKCHSSLVSGGGSELPHMMKTAASALTRSYEILQGRPLISKLVPAIALIIFALCGIAPLLRWTRNAFLHRNDNGWKKSSTYYVMTSYLQPLLLWTGATLVCRALDPVVLPTEASQIVKQRLLNFVRSLSTVLAFAYCLSSAIQQAQKFFMETNESSDTRTMGFQFAGKAVYSAVWVAAVSLFMELLGFSTQKWLTAGGLGTVLLTLAGREIFTNFLSSAMIHATRPFIVNEWIQTKIEGYEVSGFVEHVGWWSPTIVRGEDREAVHIPNHKFTVNVVRNLSQKTHWRIKTHLAISHLDVNKINNIVADMRKVLAKNPQVEHKRLHRRVFLDNIHPENQALLILISCFVKTSHHEEYLRVKEAILLDLLRVISHHRARLATPIRTVQKIYSDTDLENVPFADSIFNHGGVPSRRPLLMIEPSYKINGEDKSKNKNRSSKDSETPSKPAAENTSKVKEAPPFSDGPAVVEEITKKLTSKQPILKKDSKVDLEKSNSEAVDMQVKTESEKPQPPLSRPALEENIVLGVALEGSKRTLPIEDDYSPSSESPPEVKEKEMTTSRKGSSGPLTAEKDKKDGQIPSSPSD